MRDVARSPKDNSSPPVRCRQPAVCTPALAPRWPTQIMIILISTPPPPPNTQHPTPNTHTQPNPTAHAGRPRSCIVLCYRYGRLGGESGHGCNRDAAYGRWPHPRAMHSCTVTHTQPHPHKPNHNPTTTQLSPASSLPATHASAPQKAVVRVQSKGTCGADGPRRSGGGVRSRTPVSISFHTLVWESS